MSKSKHDADALRAVDVFGGAEALARRLALMTRVTREARGFSPSELAARAQEGDAAIVERFEDRQQLPPKHILLAYLDALSLPLQNVMQIEDLNAAREREWVNEMRRRKVALMAQGTGADPDQARTAEHKRWALEVFLRIEALNELCPPREAVPDIQRRAERVRATLHRF